MKRVQIFSIFFSAALLFLLTSCCPPFCPPAPGPGPDEKTRLSPPTVGAPLYECGTAVTVSGFVPGAKIEIYADGTTLIGGGVSDAPWGQSFGVNPALVAGQEITATQTFNGVMSPHSESVTVVDYFETHPEGLSKPTVNVPIHDCGGAISVRNLVQGGFLEVFADSIKVGGAHGCGAGQWVSINPLFMKGQEVYAVETLCNKKSPKSDQEIVMDAPSSLPQPFIEEVYEGGNYCTVRNITNGAMVRVFNGPSQIGGHYCPGGGQIMRLNPQPAAGDSLTAVQSLCTVTSDPSVPTVVKPCSELPAPIVGALCAGDNFITVSGTAPDSRIRVYADGSVIGDGGGHRINLLRSVNGEETITVTQSLGTCTSPESVVRVSYGLTRTQDVFSMKNGNEFFSAEAGETSIQALVYTRGTGCAPYFTAKIPSAQDVVVKITDSLGRPAKTIALSQSGGYWDGKWDWASTFWQNIPDEIPVGEYKATLRVSHSDGSVETTEMPFYVIFGPSEVSAPSEFALSAKGETGIWFGSSYGSDRALTYALHPDDSRVFEVAMKTIKGQTDSYTAAGLLKNWVANHFGYDLSYHTNDVIDLLMNHSKAQCADEANMLTALLRAAGIPAHPATADAAVEYGGYNWNFDTWTEARVKNGSNPEQWYILHPHEYPAMAPEARTTFGSSAGVATKKADDVVIMAGPGWISSEVSDGNSDVTFGYGTPCKEPDHNFSYVASWLEHLCLQGYWGTGHWTCSPARIQAIRIHLDKKIYSVGDEILMDIVVENVLDKSIQGNLEIQLINDDPISRKWPDALLKTFEEKVDLKPGETYRTSKSYRLRENLSAENTYGVLVKIPDMEKPFHELLVFRVKPRFSWDLKLPSRVQTGGKFSANLSLKNESDMELKNLNVKVNIPLNIEGRLVSKIPTVLLPDSTQDITWEFQALSPSAVSQFIFDVRTENGGAVKIYQGMEILNQAENRK